MDSTCPVPTLQAGGGVVMVWGNAPGSDYLFLSNHNLPSSSSYFQDDDDDDAPCHRVKIVSNWFHDLDIESSVLQRTFQSVDPVEILWDVVGQEVNVHLKKLYRNFMMQSCEHGQESERNVFVSFGIHAMMN